MLKELTVLMKYEVNKLNSSCNCQVKNQKTDRKSGHNPHLFWQTPILFSAYSIKELRHLPQYILLQTM